MNADGVTRIAQHGKFDMWIGPISLYGCYESKKFTTAAWHVGITWYSNPLVNDMHKLTHVFFNLLSKFYVASSCFLQTSCSQCLLLAIVGTQFSSNVQNIMVCLNGPHRNSSIAMSLIFLVYLFWSSLCLMLMILHWLNLTEFFCVISVKEAGT